MTDKPKKKPAKKREPKYDKPLKVKGDFLELMKSAAKNADQEKKD